MLTSNVHLYKSMPFDPVKDFAPITNAGANIIVMAVQRRSAGEVGRRADRLCQGQSGQAAVRLVRHRLAASSRGRTAEAEGRRRHRPRAVSRRQPVGQRSGRRPYRHGVPELLGRRAAHSDRQDQDSGGRREDALRGDPGRADGRRDRARFRDVVVARLLRAGRNARADRRAPQRRDRQDPQVRCRQGAPRHPGPRRAGGHAAGAWRKPSATASPCAAS